METVIGANDYALLGAKRSELDVSPKISVLYHLGRRLSLYASWAKGFKSGGVNAISLTGAHLEFEPENARTIEIGAKAKVLHDTLQMNLALYRTKFENLQVLAFNGVFLDVKNAAEATSEGVELESEWLTPYEPLHANRLARFAPRALRLVTPGLPLPSPRDRDATGSERQADRVRPGPDRHPDTDVHLSSVPRLAFTLALDVQYVGDQFTDHRPRPAHRCRHTRSIRFAAARRRCRALERHLRRQGSDRRTRAQPGDRPRLLPGHVLRAAGVGARLLRKLRFVW